MTEQNRLLTYLFYLVKENSENYVPNIPIILQVEDDPKNYNEKVTSRDFSWNNVIQDEMDSIMSNHISELVDLLKRSRSIGCKWMFRKKCHSDGTLNIYKD